MHLGVDERSPEELEAEDPPIAVPPVELSSHGGSA
jgi:hypothetical protein